MTPRPVLFHDDPPIDGVGRGGVNARRMASRPPSRQQGSRRRRSIRGAGSTSCSRDCSLPAAVEAQRSGRGAKTSGKAGLIDVDADARNDAIASTSCARMPATLRSLIRTSFGQRRSQASVVAF